MHEGADDPIVPPEPPMIWRVREVRNSLLDKSDWTQLNDSPLTDESKAEWATYRQALRDITEPEPESLEVFPDAPEIVKG